MYLPLPRLHVLVPPALPEVVEEVHLPKLCHHFRNLFLHKFWGLPMLELIFPITMGSWYRKRDRTFSNSIRCYKMESGRYAPMIRVRFPSVMTSQLTVFGSCKRAASILHPWCQYQTTRHTPPAHCPPPLFSLVGPPHRIPF